MRFFICGLACALLVFVPQGGAYADAEEGQAYFSAMATYVDDDKDRITEDGINAGQFGFGYALNETLNIEAFVQAGSASGGPDQSSFGVGVDLQRVFYRDERFSPYLHIGAGYLNVEPSGLPGLDGAMYSGGAGFLFDAWDTNVSVRGEWRIRFDTSPTENLRDNLFSLGIQVPFGDSTPRWTDADRDGVRDSTDRCPNTPAGASVDAYGCELDSDGDGVKDSMDQCPDTPRGISVDSNGCPVDSDGDGVTDDIDQCPDTPRGAPVDENGCELDSDGDGVKDSVDECPDTTAGVQVDIKGCEIREEIVLRGVNFESNSDRLVAGAESVLDDAVATLELNPTIEVEVAGHTDSDGAADYNESLSARRAQTVHDYLAANGISVDRMTVRGYGESQPIADNSTAAGKAENRRVVLRITAR
ncbi:MAG: OmpA family protein [Woeseiaceae bacterium]|nr:OmpA family protein [Woeseiaceae bacterium]